MCKMEYIHIMEEIKHRDPNGEREHVLTYSNDSDLMCIYGMLPCWGYQITNRASMFFLIKKIPA